MRRRALSLLAITTILVLAVTGQPAQAACETPLGTRNEGTIIYNADHKVAQLCTGTEWVALNGGFSSGGSGSGGSSMIDGWPDAVTCSGTAGSVALIYSYSNASGAMVYTTTFSADNSVDDELKLSFVSSSANGVFSGTSGWGNFYTTCQNKNIESLISDGQAFNFVGGGSSGSGGSAADGVDASGMIVAFESDTCPAGWSEYEPARGRFLRGIDPTGANDPDGARAAGSVQEDQLQDHQHGYNRRSDVLTGGGTVVYRNTGSHLGGTISDSYSRRGTETRPKNVAVTFCRYDGDGMLLGGGEGGGSADNLGNHTATQNLNLATHKLVGEGGTDGIYVNVDGNVGIGTVSPVNKLSVVGSSGGVLGNFETQDAGNSTVAYKNSGKVWYSGLRGDTSNAFIISDETDSRLIIGSTGNVGIGTTAPSAKLHVNSGASTIGRLSTGTAYQGITFGGATIAGYNGRVLIQPDTVPGSGTAQHLTHFSNAGSTGTTVHNVAIDGNVGIGTNSPGYTLHVNGSVAGSGAYVNLSDRRFKTSVAPSPYGLDQVLSLNPVTYDWISPTERTMEGRQLGLIAQEVEEIVPEAVTTADDMSQTKSLAYGTLMPVLIKAIQELKAENDNIRAENAAQNEKIEAMISDIEGLRAAINR